MRTSPGGSRGAVGLVLLASLAGAGLVLRARAGQPHREAERQGLRLRVERAVWLHEATDHGSTAALPVLPGGPAPGTRRLAVELSVFNARSRPVDFRPAELRLTGGRAATEALRAFTLGPAERLLLTLSFDVPRTRAPLRLGWERDGERAELLDTRRPGVADEAPGGWPESVAELPPGSAEAGEALYRGRLACTGCHGDIAEPDSARLGPSLEDFARVGARRIEGLSAAQYVYESLLNPNAFIAPQCPGGMPCARPSPMPLYGEVLSAQEMADVIHYLVSTRVGG